MALLIGRIIFSGDKHKPSELAIAVKLSALSVADAVVAEVLYAVDCAMFPIVGEDVVPIASRIAHAHAKVTRDK